MTKALRRTRTLVFAIAAASLFAACDGSKLTSPESQDDMTMRAAPTNVAAQQTPIAKIDEHLSAADIARIKAELERIAAAARTCANNGYQTVTTSNGKDFRNPVECLLYATLGGSLVPKVVVVPPPVITDFQETGPINCDRAPGVPLIYGYIATFTGGAGSVDNGVGSVTSGTPFTGPDLSTTLTLTVTNSQGVSVTSGLFPLGYVIVCPGGGGAPE